MLASSIQNIKASVLRRRPLGSVPGWRSIFALSPSVDCNNRVTEPISNEEFQEMMSRCNLKKSDPNKKYLIAVSGGPDSAALCYLASQWVQNKNQLVALTVDHKLRQESTYEAESVHKWLESLNIEHVIETIQWDSVPGVNRVELEARQNRYQLLEKVCREKHVNTILVAHHADDQVETFLMRFYRNSGIHGLKGMEHVYKKSKDVRIVRPLLTVRKSRLIATCENANIQYFEDPSNRDLHYDRNRTRYGIFELSQRHQLDFNAIYSLQQYISDIDGYITAERNGCMQKTVKCNYKFGYYTIDLSMMTHYPNYIASRVLGTLLQSVCNANYPPRNSILNPILEDIYTHHGVLSRGYTCLNSIITPLSSDPTIALICPSYPTQRYIDYNLYLPQPLQMYKSILFDNRLTVTLLPNNKQYEHPHKRDIKGWEPLHLNLHTTQFYCRCLKENERNQIRISFPKLCKKKGINESLLSTIPVVTTYMYSPVPSADGPRKNQETIVLVPSLGISRLNGLKLKSSFNAPTDLPSLPIL